MMQTVRTNRPGGFSLIELLISLAILALLASLAVPALHVSQQRRKEQALRLALREIRAALDQHKSLADQGRIAQPPGASGYPARLGDLVQGVPDVHSPNGDRIRLLRRLPPDPMSATEEADTASNWGLRSYQSDAAAPEAGRDVFDVYSKSTAQGLNGKPYNSW